MKDKIKNFFNNKVKKFFTWLVRTKLGWCLISFIWIVIWMGVYNHTAGDWPFWVAVPGMAYLVGLTLVMMAYGWVINPIREWKKRRKNKK